MVRLLLVLCLPPFRFPRLLRWKLVGVFPRLAGLLLAILTLSLSTAAAPTLYRSGDRLRAPTDDLLDVQGRIERDTPRLAWEGGASAHALRTGIDGSVILFWHLDIQGTPYWWDLELRQRADGSVVVREGRPGWPCDAHEFPSFGAFARSPGCREALRVLLPRQTATPALLVASLLPEVVWRPLANEDVRWVMGRVARLDHVDWRERERATGELVSDPYTLPALRRLLREGGLSAEQRSRVRAVVGGE